MNVSSPFCQEVKVKALMKKKTTDRKQSSILVVIRIIDNSCAVLANLYALQWLTNFLTPVCKAVP